MVGLGVIHLLVGVHNLDGICRLDIHIITSLKAWGYTPTSTLMSQSLLL